MFLGCVEFAIRPYRKIDDDHRKPLARYGAMESALRERLAPSELHHSWDTTILRESLR